MKKNFISLLWLFLICSWVYWYTDYELSSANKLGKKDIIVYQENSGDYNLDNTITRKEFMKVIAKIVWEDIWSDCSYNFRDVKNDWWCKYIEWALKKEFIANNKDFRPNDPITKAESMKLILKARWISRYEYTSDWRNNDMETAYVKWIIEGRYSDFDTYAKRWWIFAIVATEIDTFWWSSSSGVWSGDSSSGSGYGSSSSSSSGNSSSSSWGGDDWRNRVP